MEIVKRIIKQTQFQLDESIHCRRNSCWRVRKSIQVKAIIKKFYKMLALSFIHLSKDYNYAATISISLGKKESKETLARI